MTRNHHHEKAPLRDDGLVNTVGLFSAAETGDLGRVEWILESEPDLANVGRPKYAQRHWQTKPIHVAAREGHAEVVRLLLEVGADPMAEFHRNTLVRGALSLARHRGHADVVQVIEEHMRARLDGDPAALHRVDESGNTLLHQAVYHGHWPLVRELLDRGAEVDRRNKRDQRPIHISLYMADPRPILRYEPPDLLMAGILLDHGAECDIWVASALGDAQAVRRLLEANPALANAESGPRTYPGASVYPLTIAALRGHLEVVRLLLDHGADPDAANITHYTYENQQESGAPLIFAISHGHFDVAHLLLDRGARVDYSFLDSAAGVADYAYESGSRELFERIIVGGGKLQMGHWLRSRNYPLIGEILDRCLDDPVGDPLGCGDQPTLAQALLELGAWLGDSNVVKMCLQREPKLRDGEDFTLLQQAMHSHNRWNDWEGYASVVRLLLEYGVNPNGRGDRSATLLHLVSTESYWARFPGEYDDEMVAFAGLLLDGGAEVNARDSEMKATPLAWAARYGHRKSVEFLLERGAATNLPDDAPGSTPLAWAEGQGHAEIAEVLRQHGAR